MTAETGSDEEAQKPKPEQTEPLKRDREEGESRNADGPAAKVTRTEEDGKSDATKTNADQGEQSEEEKKKALLAAKKAALARILEGMSQAAEKEDAAKSEQKSQQDSAAAEEDPSSAAVADTSIVDFLRKESEGAVGKFLSAKKEAAAVGVIAAAPVYERREPTPAVQAGTLALQTTSAAAGPKAVSSRAGPSWAGKGGVAFAPQKWTPAPRAQAPAAAAPFGWSPAPKFPATVPPQQAAAAPPNGFTAPTAKENTPARPLFVPAAAKPGFGAPLPGAGRW
mmetsp:Transcript_48/g.77  ORF Transcript_48/g.77 Transcript_48/m.77 type:complete len:281 (-) Transcript_48:82-924(-)